MSASTTIERSPVETVLRYYDCIDDGDLDAALSCFAADATYHRPGYAPLVGIAAITAYYRDTRVIGDGRHTIADVVSDGRTVAVRGSFAGHSRTGDDLAVAFSDFWEFRDGSVTARRTFFDAPAV